MILFLLLIVDFLFSILLLLYLILIEGQWMMYEILLIIMIFDRSRIHQNHRLIYQYIHFQGVTPEQLADAMKTKGDFVSMIALFGWGRHTDRLNSEYKPLTYGEIDAEVRIYADYIKNFNPRSAPDTILSYVVAPKDWEIDFTNIDRWYERELIAEFPSSTLYRVKLKN